MMNKKSSNENKRLSRNFNETREREDYLGESRNRVGDVIKSRDAPATSRNMCLTEIFKLNLSA